MARPSKDQRIAHLEAEVANIRGAWKSAMEARDKAIELANCNACNCRCHTGTCGENDMVLAERTIQLIRRLSISAPDAIEAVDYLVRRAGVDFARTDIGLFPTDDEVPF